MTNEIQENVVAGIWQDKVLLLDERLSDLRGAVKRETRVLSMVEAYELAGLKRPSKLLRMLRALWRVKNA